MFNAADAAHSRSLTGSPPILYDIMISRSDLSPSSDVKKNMVEPDKMIKEIKTVAGTVEWKI